MISRARRFTDSRIGGREGFTFIELMIALLIMGFLLTAIYRVFISQESMFRAQEQAAEMQENLRATTEFLHQEMSWLGYGVPNLSVVYAGTSQIIYKSNLPNTGSTVSFIRYTYDATNESIMRSVESSLAGVQNNNNLKVLANDVDSLAFSYFDGFGAEITAIPAVSPTNDNALATIRRVRAAVVVKSSRPDWNYTHPTAKDNYRRRSSVVQVKTRNVEDVTVTGGGVGTGTCSSFTMSVSYPGTAGTYSACPDKQSEIATGTQTLTDNPLVTVTVADPNGAPDNNTPVSISATYGYIFKDSGGTERSVISGRSNGIGSVYLGADATAIATEGTTVTISTYFTPPEAGCLQLSNTEALTITSGSPSRFDTTAPYGVNKIGLGFVYLDSGNNIAPAPSTLAVCSSASNVGAKFAVRLEDDCDNGIENETVAFSIAPSGKGSFQAGTSDNGDGSYDVVYIPPDTLTTGVPSETVTISAQWGTATASSSITLIPGAAYDLAINSMEGPKDGGGSYLYQFTSPTSNSFNMERVSNQHVRINFSVLDACGNRVFGQAPNLSAAPSYGSITAITAEADGTYTFDWYSPFGCGPPVSNQTIVISNTSITTSLASETVDFNLLASLEPRLNLSVSKGGSPVELSAGCTADQVDITAVLQEYDPVVDECVNIVRPEGSVTDSYAVTFTVAGANASLGNGSFNHADLTQDTLVTNTDALGYAYGVLNPGSSMKNQILTVTATADVDGQIYPQTASVQVPLSVSTPNTGSGFYDSVYSAKKGANEAVRHYDPADSIYVQIGDCDENEYVFQADPLGSPAVSVILVSQPTGDSEKILLTETGANSATFRFSTGVVTQLNPVASPNDSILQVGYGDKITMTYVDNDDPAPATQYTYDVFISGPRWLKLYRDDGGGAESLILSGGAQVLTMYNNDKLRPKVYIPRLEGDSSLSTDLVTILDSSGSGGESETVTLRESADSGIFVPDSSTYGQDYILVSKSGSIPLAQELFLPYTPKTVTVQYPATGPVKSASFVVEDEDLPLVRVDSPTDGSTVSGTVTIQVYAEDINNTISPSIDQIELYIDGYLVETRTGADLTGTNSFTWTTAAGGVPYWLDGTHTIYAKAMDGAGNWNTSSSISVTVANGLQTIWFTSPSNNSIYNSTTVNVGLQTANLDTVNTSYSVTLKIGTTFRTLTALGGDAYSYSWATGPSSEGTGVKAMLATVQDSQGNTESATWSAIVDHTPPTIVPGDAANLWVGDTAPYAWSFQVRDDYGFADSTRTVLVSMSGSSGFTDQPAQWGGSIWDSINQVNVASYSLSWAGPGSGIEDSRTWSVKAWDSSTPAPGNLGTGSLAFNFDNIHPTMDSLTVSATYGSPSPTWGSFVKGTVVLDTAINDTHPYWGWLVFYNYDTGAWVEKHSAGFDLTSNPAIAFTWQTNGNIPSTVTPWPQGGYVVFPYGIDLALNWDQNAGVAYSSFYVDNNAPSIVGSNSPAIPNYVTSVVSVPYNADANFGFLASVGYSIFDSSGSTVANSAQTFSVASAVAATKSAFTVDSRALADNGPYSIAGSAADHALNSSSTAKVPFEVCNRVAAIGTVTWTFVMPNDWQLQLDGSLEQLTPSGPAPADGLMDITVTNLNSSNSFAYSVNTVTPGKFTFPHLVLNTELFMSSGDTIQVDVENSDSGCAATFTMDGDTNTSVLP